MQTGQGQAKRLTKAAEETKSGFTLIEVMLTLAIAGAIFVGLVGGLSGTVARQRYTAEVDSFAEYLRNVYSEVSNPQGMSESGGTSTTQAIYGRLLIMGYSSNENGQYIADYSVLGSVDASSASLNFNLSSLTSTEVTTISNALDLRLDADNFTTYSALNGVTITTTGGVLPELAVLVIRNLSGGTIRTYVYECTSNTVASNNHCIYRHSDGTVEMRVGEVDIDTSDTITSTDTYGYRFNLTNFKEMDVNFCVVSDDSDWAGGTRNVRLLAGGSSSNAVQIVDQDSEDNLCQGLDS